MITRLRSNSHGYRIGAMASLFGALTLYGISLAPTVQGFDSAELTVGAYTLGFVHPPGYPLYMLLGHLFSRIPVGNVGLRVNFMSAVFGSLTTLVLYSLLYVQTNNWETSLVATFLFATAPYFWSQAVRAEVYTLHTFLMVGALLAWFDAHHRRQISSYVVCFILLGVGMGNHLTTALLWMSVLISSIWELPRWRRVCLGSTLLGGIIGAACYLYFPWRSRAMLQIDYIQPYFEVNLNSVKGLWWLVSGQAFHYAFYLDSGLAGVFQRISRFGTFIWNGSLGIGLILGLWGWWRLKVTHSLWNRLLSLYFMVNFIAFTYYHVVDKEAMFLPSYLVMSVWIAHGMKGLAKWSSKHLQSISPDQANTFVHLGLLIIVVLGVGFNWRLVDLSHNQRTYNFAAQLLKEVDPSTTIVNHWSTASVVDYLKIVEGKRPDVRSFNLSFYWLGLKNRYGSLDTPAAQAEWQSWLTKQLKNAPVCLVEPLPPIPEGFQLSDQGSCWELTEKAEK